MKSQHAHHGNRWAHCNTPAALRRRKAAADARREVVAEIAGPVYEPPAPLSDWQMVLVLNAHGEVMHRIALFVPTSGRCDQHAVDIDGERALMTATDIGRRVASMIYKRPSLALQSQIKREI